ncbi:hypothetical protein V8G54_017908 [Vigna mungo]|uniref:Uncharacterized protein n=1 Tax=Vigna mungo TaxID=3915 RepID=A0AAQ3RS68_VIGMU
MVVTASRTCSRTSVPTLIILPASFILSKPFKAKIIPLILRIQENMVALGVERLKGKPCNRHSQEALERIPEAFLSTIVSSLDIMLRIDCNSPALEPLLSKSSSCRLWSISACFRSSNGENPETSFCLLLRISRKAV